MNDSIIGIYFTANVNIGMSIANEITCLRIAANCELGIQRIEEGKYQGQYPRESET
jgi:hypothetical protein